MSSGMILTGQHPWVQSLSHRSLGRDTTNRWLSHTISISRPFLWCPWFYGRILPCRQGLRDWNLTQNRRLVLKNWTKANSIFNGCILWPDRTIQCSFSKLFYRCKVKSRKQQIWQKSRTNAGKVETRSYDKNPEPMQEKSKPAAMRTSTGSVLLKLPFLAVTVHTHHYMNLPHFSLSNHHASNQGPISNKLVARSLAHQSGGT